MIQSLCLGMSIHKIIVCLPTYQERAHTRNRNALIYRDSNPALICNDAGNIRFEGMNALFPHDYISY
jgi:hypothetical protein